LCSDGPVIETLHAHFVAFFRSQAPGSCTSRPQLPQMTWKERMRSRGAPVKQAHVKADQTQIFYFLTSTLRTCFHYYSRSPVQHGNNRLPAQARQNHSAHTDHVSRAHGRRLGSRTSHSPLITPQLTSPALPRPRSLTPMATRAGTVLRPPQSLF
jgi:hypothetical protein